MVWEMLIRPTAWKGLDCIQSKRLLQRALSRPSRSRKGESPVMHNFPRPACPGLRTIYSCAFSRLAFTAPSLCRHRNRQACPKPRRRRRCRMRPLLPPLAVRTIPTGTRTIRGCLPISAAWRSTKRPIQLCLRPRRAKIASSSWATRSPKDGISTAQRSFPGKPYINRGISGQTSPQMLLRFRQDVIALQPKVVVILAGTNDIAGNTGPMTLEQTEDNIASMADIATANHIHVVLCSVLPAYRFSLASGTRTRTEDRRSQHLDQVVRGGEGIRLRGLTTPP